MTLEFSQNDDAPVNLSEMRFHIPISELAGETDPAETFRGNNKHDLGVKDLKAMKAINNVYFK